MLKLVTELHGHEGRVWHASWSPDGTKIASCGEDKIIRIWGRSNLTSEDSDFSTLNCISTLEEGQSRTIRCVEWSPDGKMIASASFDGSVVVWQALDIYFTIWEKAAALEGHDSEVKSVSWSHDGTFLASCGRDKKVWVWERLQGGEFECVSMLDGHTQDVKFVKWHPRTNALFSCGYDDVVKVWMDDGDDDWFCVSTMTFHTSTVWGCTFDGDGGNSCITISDDKSIVLWENEEPSNPRNEWMQVAVIRDICPDPLYTCDWNYALNLIAIGSGDNAIHFFNHMKADDGRGVLSKDFIQNNAHDGDINCIRWNTINHSFLLSAGDDSIIKLWTISI